MGLLDSLKGLFSKTNKTEEQVKGVLDSAEGLTKMIPGDADDKLVANIKDQVENVTDKYDEVKKNLPGEK